MGQEQIKQQQLLHQQQMLQQQQQSGRGGPQKAQQNAPPQLSKQHQLEIQGQKSAQGLNSQMGKIDDMIARKTHEAETLEARIKELISQGKKTQAKQQVVDLKQLKANIQNFETRRRVLANQVNSIQMATVDVSMVHTMGQANEYMKQNEQVNQKMNDILLDQKEIQAQMAETNHLMTEMAQSNNQQDEEDLFKELEMQVARQKAQVVNQQLQQRQTQPQVNVVQPSYVQPQSQQSKQVYAPMATGQQYTSQAPGLTSQYQPYTQTPPPQSAQQYSQPQYNQPQSQYRTKTSNNHIDQITRMLNG